MPRSALRTLVTGGAGFLGSRLVHKLLTRGHCVRVLDNLTTGRLENLDDVSGAVDFVAGDLRDPSALKRSLQNIDCVFHLAAMVSVPECSARPADAYSVNAEGTRFLLDHALDFGVGRIVYASSCSVYGPTPRRAIDESHPPGPLAPYAASKYMGEQHVIQHSRLFGLEGVALRFFNLYGPGQRADSPYAAVVPIFFDALAHKRAPVIFGDGKQTRDFLFVDDAVDALLRAATRASADGEVLNIGSSKRVSVLSLWNRIARLSPKAARAPKHRPERAGDIRHSLADVTLAKKHLGFEAAAALGGGLRQIWEQRLGG